MTSIEAIRLLEANGFTFLHQAGSHKKYGRGDDRICVVYKTKKYHIHYKEEKKIKELVKKYQNASHGNT